MSNINLTSSMRSNLLSLQQTAKLQDLTQNRLSTGLKVSTAVDNPSSFYTAQALNARADDLNALLDSMGQGIQTIKAANEALEAGLKFLEQAKATANQAAEKAPQPSYDGPIAAKVTTEAELLAAINNTTAADGVIFIANDIALSKNIGLTLKDGQKLVGANYVYGNGKNAKLTFDFDKNNNAIGIDVGKDALISDLKIDYSTTQKTNSNDFNAIRNNGKSGVVFNNLDIKVSSNENSGNTSAAIRNLGVGEIELQGTINISAQSDTGKYVVGIRGTGTSSKMTQAAGSVLNINASAGDGYGIYEGINTLAGTVNITTAKSSAIGLRDGVNIISGTLNISTSGIGGNGIRGGTNTISGAVNITTSERGAHAIYQGTHKVMAGAQLLVQAKGATADTIYNASLNYEIGAKIGLSSPNNPAGAGLWIAAANQDAAANASWNTLDGAAGWNRIGGFPGIPAMVDFMSVFTAPTDTANISLSAMADSYNSILGQYNQLINDSGYKGVNLLKEQNLKVNFNEDRSSSIEISGKDASTKGLGVSSGSWTYAEDIEKSINELEDAIAQIRSMSSEFGNYYSIVTNHEEFTHNLINVLIEGADKLTLADMNEESANTLALQTRQQLAVNSLSLASQASQSVLKLF